MDMVSQMVQMLALGLLFIYLVMVAQFQSLLSPFIILFTVPLAFTGGLIGLLIAGEQLSMMSLMGFMVLMGTVVTTALCSWTTPTSCGWKGWRSAGPLCLPARPECVPF